MKPSSARSVRGRDDAGRGRRARRRRPRGRTARRQAVRAEHRRQNATRRPQALLSAQTDVLQRRRRDHPLPAARREREGARRARAARSAAAAVASTRQRRLRQRPVAVLAAVARSRAGPHVRDAALEQRVDHRRLGHVLDAVDVRVAGRTATRGCSPSAPTGRSCCRRRPPAHPPRRRGSCRGPCTLPSGFPATSLRRRGPATRSLRRIAATCERTVAGETTSVRAICAVVILRRISSSTSHSREVSRGSPSRRASAPAAAARGRGTPRPGA